MIKILLNCSTVQLNQLNLIEILLNCNTVQLNQLNLIPKVAKMQDCLPKSIQFDIKNKMRYCSNKSINRTAKTQHAYLAIMNDKDILPEVFSQKIYNMFTYMI